MTAPTVESVATLAGCELDKAVQEHVFGISPRMVRAKAYTDTFEVQTNNPACRDGVWTAHELTVYFQAPGFSTDPAAFFALMEKVRENGWRVSIEEASGSFRGKHKWRVTLTDKSGWLRHGFGNDLPLAFARAALLTTITPKGG